MYDSNNNTGQEEVSAPDEKTALLAPSDIISINNVEESPELTEMLLIEISRQRKGMLGISYSSYVIPGLYAFFLFINISQYLMQLNKEHIGEEDHAALYILFRIFILAIVGAGSISDYYTNIIATTPIPELVYDLINKKAADELYQDATYRELTSYRKSMVRTTSYVSKFFAIGSFLIIGLSSVDPLYDYINNLPGKIAISVPLIPLGAYYGGLLLYNRTMQHHVWISSRIYGSLKDIGFYIKNKPLELIEFSVQLNTNVFYKMLTYGFIAAAALKQYGITNSTANIVTVGISAFLGGFQTFFTRFRASKIFILDADIIAICSKNYKFFTFNRIGNLAFGLTRSTGLIYIVWRYNNLTYPYTIIICSAVGFPLVLQNVFYSLRVKNFLSQNKVDNNGIAWLNSVSNFLSRLIRTGAIMAFTKELDKFLSVNGIKLDINDLDAFMISMASVGVESVNWHFYKIALQEGVKSWEEKARIEKKHAALNNSPFSYGRFFGRSKKEYPQIKSPSDIILGLNGDSESQHRPPPPGFGQPKK